MAAKGAKSKNADTTLAQNAERRVQMKAYIESHPGVEMTAADMAEGLGWELKTARYIAQNLKANGLIAGRRDGMRNLYSAADGAASTVRIEKTKKAKQAQDVELVMAGILIVIGRNVKTGRLRITLEET